MTVFRRLSLIVAGIRYVALRVAVTVSQSGDVWV